MSYKSLVPMGPWKLLNVKFPNPLRVRCVLKSRLAASAMRAMNEVFPLERAAEAYEHMMSGKARFRAVLTTGR